MAGMPKFMLKDSEEGPAALIVTTPKTSEPLDRDLRIIGLGTCGTVFEIPNTRRAWKKGSRPTSIRQGFDLIQKVHLAMEAARGLIQERFPSMAIAKVLECYEYHSGDDEGFWTEHQQQRFPVGWQIKEPIFSMDRILPLPRKVRETLIDLYFDESESVQEEAQRDPRNEDCLIRLYLGERESPQQQEQAHTSLRNFEMRLNMMRDLDLDVESYATEMAIGLAIVHWQAQVDAMDTEFVLGMSPSSEQQQ